MSTARLTVSGLEITLEAATGTVTPVDSVDLSLPAGRTLALVGESGCGKSLTALAILRLLPRGGRVTAGAVRLDETELTSLPEEELRSIRGRRIGMIFQDPMTSLNPVYQVGYQVREALTAHLTMNRREARDRALELLDEVGLADPEVRYRQYPHELSGGMRQRVMIAIAIACQPDFLIADEPTTALDVTVQAQILELLDSLRQTRGMGVLLITHDLGIVAGLADRVAVMYAGRVVESGPTREIFRRPRHPYTAALLASVPQLHEQPRRLEPIRGTVPDPLAWPAGCRFHPRCPKAVERCRHQIPASETVALEHQAACWVAADAAQ